MFWVQLLWLFERRCATPTRWVNQEYNYIVNVEKKAEESAEKSDDLEKMRNGCCKECMKAFSSTGKVRV